MLGLDNGCKCGVLLYNLDVCRTWTLLGWFSTYETAWDAIISKESNNRPYD